jgi:hypothetical protein
MGEHNFFYKLGKSALETFVSLNAVYGDEALKNSTHMSDMPNLKTVKNQYRMRNVVAGQQ